MFGSLDLGEVKAIRNAHGTTVNDVVASLCAGAVRRRLVAHDELPSTPLVAEVPVSVRTEEQSGTFGNRTLLMHAPFLTNIEDLAERLRRTHERSRT